MRAAKAHAAEFHQQTIAKAQIGALARLDWKGQEQADAVKTRSRVKLIVTIAGLISMYCAPSPAVGEMFIQRGRQPIHIQPAPNDELCPYIGRPTKQLSPLVNRSAFVPVNHSS